MEAALLPVWFTEDKAIPPKSRAKAMRRFFSTGWRNGTLFVAIQTKRVSVR